MVRREIKNFELITEDGRYPCQLPCSVHSVLEAAGADISEIGSGVSLESRIYVDDVALAMRNFYLRIRGVNSPAEVYIGDRMIGECDGKSPVCNLNAAGLMEKGDNILSVRFKPASDLRYAGISSPVEVLRFSGAIIDRIGLTQRHEEDSVILGISLDLIGNSESVRAVATLVSSSGQIYYAGLTRGKGSITVNDPLYWWPKGLGVQNLYRLTVTLYGDTDVEDSCEMRIGFRTVSISDGSSLLVNGVKALPMGAVYVADDEPDLAVANRKAEAYVTSASMAGFNCLVIPENSPRPTEKFYDLCDVHGIMVIEEHSELSEGRLDTLRRNAHHASLSLIDLVGCSDVSLAKSLIKRALPDISVAVFDSYEEYVCAPSLPSMKTLRTVVPEAERSLFSYSVEAIAEEGAIRDMLLSVAERYPYPGDLSSFAYASALAAANKVGGRVKECRLSEGRLGRAVFSRLGDVSLAISSSAIDHRARWKPLQYYSARHFAPVKLYADYEGGRVVFSASNTRRIDFVGSLEYRIADASNYTILRGAEAVEVEALTAKKLISVDISEQIKGHEREYYLEFCLKEGSSQLSKSVLLFVPEKHFEFKKPKLKTVVTGSDRRFSLTVSSDVFVKDLELDFDGVDAVFSDNYIDLTSDAPVKMDFTVTGSAETTYHLKDVMQLRSVFDLK